MSLTLLIASIYIISGFLAISFAYRGSLSQSRYSVAHALRPRIRNSALFGELSDTNKRELAEYNWGNQPEFPTNPQEEVYSENLADEEVLDLMRKERILNNDRWQTTLFRDSQGGEWTGSYELFIPRYGPEGISLQKGDVGTVNSKFSANEFTMVGVNITAEESYISLRKGLDSQDLQTAETLLLRATRESFVSTDFRAAAGNQVVGNVFSLCKTEFAAGDDQLVQPVSMVAEIAVREGPIRHRVRWAFTKQPTAALGPKEYSSYELSLLGILIIRESVLDASPMDLIPLLDPKLGPGIWDPQEGGEPYVQIDLPGKLSLLFPRGLSAATGHGTLTVEWEGRERCFQVDRKFRDLSGGLKSLELTEIRTEDAAKYLPDFPTYDILK